jgi:O-antigen/teichoic acid export membrane protein
MFRKFMSSFGLSAIGFGAAFGSQLLLARMLSASEYGVFSFISSLSLMIGVFALFGFQSSAVRLIAQYRADDVLRGKIAPFIGFAIFFTGVLAAVFGFIVYGGLSLTSYADVYSYRAFLIGIALIAVMVMVRLLSAFMHGFERSICSVLYETTLREVLFLLAIGAAFLMGFGVQSGADALLVLVAVSFCVMMIAGVHVHRQESGSSGDFIGDRMAEYKEWIAISFPMMLTVFAQRMMRRSDIVILGLMVSPALVGAYAIAANFADASAMGQKGVYAVFSARAARLFKAGQLEELKAFYKQMQLYGFVSVGAISVLIAAAFPFVIEWFGEAYKVGYVALLILLFGQVVNIAFGPVGMLMIMTEHEKVAMRYTGFAVLGNVIFNPLAIVFFGLEGAAFVAAFFLIVRGAVSYFFVKRQGLI